MEYEDDPSIGPGKRTCEPVALGYSKRNNKVLRAYQTSGPSLKVSEGGDPLPQWRLFRLDRIKILNQLKAKTLYSNHSQNHLYITL